MRVAVLSRCKAKLCLAQHRLHRAGIRVCVLAALFSLGGCGEAGAPSLDLFGAFFPAWLLCAVLGIFVALGARLFFAARNLVDLLPFQLPLCTSLGTIVA